MPAARPAKASRPRGPRTPSRVAAPRATGPWLPGGVWTLAALAVAAGLRLWNLRHGLPDFLDEAIPFRRALAMWDNPGGAVDWNPHFFQYPSLTLYLHLFLQKVLYAVGVGLGTYHTPADFQLAFYVDPTSMVLAARLLHVVADLVTVALMARNAEQVRPGSAAAVALLVGCSPILIEASRAIYTDTIMTTLGVAALERMLAYRREGGNGRLAWAAILVGLAAGAKYPAAVLLLPLAWLVWARERTRVLTLGPAAALLAAAAFLVTTPYALLDRETFVHELTTLRALATGGHLGSLGQTGFQFYLFGLVAEIGWPGLVLAILGLALGVRRAASRETAVALGLALLGYAAPISMGHAEAKRYLIPVIPLAAAFLVAGLLEIAARVPERRRRLAFAALFALAAIPALRAGALAGAVSTDDTQIEARKWCEAHLGPEHIVVQEAYGAPLLSRTTWLDLRRSPEYTDASPPWRARLDGRKWYSSVLLPIVVVGNPRVEVKRPGGERVELQIFPHVVDLNQMIYEPRLLAGVDYVVTSGGVRHRFEEDTVRFAVERRFYALLDSAAEAAARIVPRRGAAGPDITIYRLGPRAQAAIARLGPFDPLWWAECVPRSYRETANSLFTREGEEPTLERRHADGRLAPWVRSLKPMVQSRLQPTTHALALECQLHSRFGPARDLAGATLAMVPEDVASCMIFADGAGRAGEWAAARDAIARTISSIARVAEVPPALRYQYAESLARTGDLAGARAELEKVAAASDPVLAEQARSALQSSGGTFRAVR